jgi:hypothetical protein
MSYQGGHAPFIKSEPDEFGNNPNRYVQANSYGQQTFSNPFHHQDSASIDPSALSMPNSTFNQTGFGSGPQNISSSFSTGNAGLTEDDLLFELSGGLDSMNDFLPQQQQQLNNQTRVPGSVPVNQQQMSHVYSSTPEGPPIQSPYLGQPDYSHFRNLNSLPSHMSPLQNPSYMAMKRPSVQTQRKSSDQRSPMTPRTAAMANLQIGTPESGSLANGRPVRTPSVQHRHQKTMSAQYDSTPGSFGSYIDSPLSSPSNALQHPTIVETMSAHGSLPSKIENGHGTTSQESQEAKKRRRRASHNAVERRRRDNINERIQDLSHLVPQHRLDDDKVKKQLANAGPLSPTIGATGMSPPNANNTATSLLAGANGRRAASTVGNITIGLPVEEREKGPNKGDILNGAVSWTRDLMWALHQKYVQEDELANYITGLGGQWPFQVTDDEKRMRSEVLDAIEKNGVDTFSYTRTDGSGFRVPKYTTLTGDRLPTNQNSLSPQSNFELSPGFHSGGSGTNSGSNGPGQTQYWHSAGHGGISFKEEDEFMEMN